MLAGIPEFSDIIRRVNALPSLPAVAGRILQLVEVPDSDAKAIGELIALDPALSAQVLRLVNSAFSGLRREVTTISQAVVFLGFQTIRNLALAASVFDALQLGRSRRDLFYGFMTHSLAVGVAAEFLSTELLVGDPAEFLTIGILHDIGKLIQMQYLHEIFVAVREKAEREKLLFIEAERGLLPLDHAGLVGQLFERWRMPETLRESIRWHHDWNAAPLVYRRSVALLAAADRLVVNLAIGNSLNFAGYREDPALIEASGVEVRLLEAANTVIRSRMDRMRGFIDCLGS